MTELWDVVVCEVSTRKVEAITGKALRRTTGFHNAKRRLETTVGRINDHYFAAIVPSGRYAIGDVLKDGEGET